MIDNEEEKMQIKAAQDLLVMRGKVIQYSDIPDVVALCQQCNADILFEYNSLKNEYKLVSIYYLGVD